MPKEVWASARFDPGALQGHQEPRSLPSLLYPKPRSLCGPRIAACYPRSTMLIHLGSGRGKDRAGIVPHHFQLHPLVPWQLLTKPDPIPLVWHFTQVWKWSDKLALTGKWVGQDMRVFQVQGFNFYYL